MSRYSIPSTTNPAHTIHYGFDRPLQEFFVQVTTTELDESNPGRSADLILMVGTENVLYPDPKNPSKLNYSTSDLIDLIKDYGGVLPENHWSALNSALHKTDVSGSFLFDKALLDKATIKQPKYVMGVDTYDKDALAYCFGRKADGVFEIMLAKTMRDEKEFKQEVENLAKYFNADVFRSGE